MNELLEAQENLIKNLETQISTMRELLASKDRIIKILNEIVKAYETTINTLSSGENQ